MLVRFRDGVTEEGKDAGAGARGARRKGRLRGASGWERLGLPEGQDPAAAAEQWRSLPEVESAEPNYLITADQLAPDEPHLLNNLGYFLVEQDRSLAEALRLIERAVAAQPPTSSS